MFPITPANHTNAAQVRIESKAFNTTVTVTAQSALKNSGFFTAISEKLTGRKYIKLNVGKKPELVKISELSQKLGVTRSELIKASENSQGSIDNILVNLKCQTTFSNLDRLYKETAPEEKEALAAHMQELTTIKNIVRIAYQSMARSPFNKDAEIVIPVNNHKILVQDSAEGLKLDTIYGERLGMGGQGEALRSVNFMAGTAGVLKLPRREEFEGELKHEAAILNKLNPRSTVLGIQKPVRLVSDLLQVAKMKDRTEGDTFSTYGHFGAKYDTDLSEINPATIKLKDKLSIAYQLFYGLNHMHKQNITHGDIKPENIFFDQSRDPKVGPRVYLADFGGVIDHSDPDRAHSFPVTTKNYRGAADDNASYAAHDVGNLKLQQQIEAKADVFATCVSLCRSLLPKIATNPDFPYLVGGTGRPTDRLDPSLKEVLLKARISDSTSDLLIRGMSSDYKVRPDARTLLDAVRKDLEAASPNRAAAMKKLTPPALPPKGEVWVEWL